MQEPYSLTPEEEALINARADEGLMVPDRPPDEEDGDIIECTEHGFQFIISVQSYGGFAGGRCYAAQLSCGCHQTDESADVYAAY
jgi:hypothetical protein